MTKVLLLSAVLLLSIVSGAFAQEKNYDESVRKMITVSGGVSVFQMVIPQMVTMMKQQFANVPAEYWVELEKQLEKTALDDLVKMLVPVYQKHLTQSDIEEIIKFYDSPVGKKMAETAPKISMEAMQIGQQWGTQLAAGIVEQLKAKGYIQ